MSRPYDIKFELDTSRIYSHHTMLLEYAFHSVSEQAAQSNRITVHNILLLNYSES